MELSYRELSKRDVINVSDGRCLGRIIDIKLVFPEGKMIGIVVPGRKVRGFFRWFDKSEIYIEERKILKIGGDVILVDIRCNDDYNNNSHKPVKPPKHPQQPCPKPCQPDRRGCEKDGVSAEQFGAAFDDNDY